MIYNKPEAAENPKEITETLREMLTIIQDLLAENSRLKAKLDIHNAHYRWLSEKTKGSNEAL